LVQALKQLYYLKDEDIIQNIYKSSKKWLPNNMVLVKLRGTPSFKFSPEGLGKTRYMIASVKSNGEFKNLGILKQYEAVVQLQELCKQYPKILSRKAFKPTKSGTMSETFIKEIGTNAIAERFPKEVPTLQEAKAYMNAGFKGKPQDYIS
jgi:hypothetical protein